MDRAKRTRRSVAERRRQLLRIGLEVFSNTPYDAVSIDDIAEAAGISKGLLYHYWSGKREFYAAVVEEAVRDLIAVTEPDPDLLPEQRLRHSLRAYLDYVDQHRRGYLTVMHGGVGADPQIRAVVERMRQTVLDRIVDGLGIPAPPPTLVVGLRGWIGFVEGAVVSWLRGQHVTREELVEMSVRALGGVLTLLADHPVGEQEE